MPNKCVDNLFKFEENEIAKILTEDCNFIIYRRDFDMYINLSNNNIISSDSWKCDLDKHHSIAYIVNNNYYYKFPKNTINQYIKFDFIIFNGIVYHKCLTNPEIAATY